MSTKSVPDWSVPAVGKKYAEEERNPPEQRHPCQAKTRRDSGPTKRQGAGNVDRAAVPHQTQSRRHCESSLEQCPQSSRSRKKWHGVDATKRIKCIRLAAFAAAACFAISTFSLLEENMRRAQTFAPDDNYLVSNAPAVDSVKALFRKLSTSTFQDTPMGLMLQIIGINEQGDTPLYSQEDIKLIMNAVAVNTLHTGPAVHLAERSLVQHTLGSASCQLMAKATAAEVAMAAVHTFWYSRDCFSKISPSEVCEVRESLANTIGRDAEEILWQYVHLQTHGQNPEVLKMHTDMRLKQNRSSEVERKVSHFLMCDELEQMRDFDRMWYSDAREAKRRLEVMSEMAPLVGFPNELLDVFVERSNLQIELQSGEYGKTIKRHEMMWRSHVPLTHHWQLPPFVDLKRREDVSRLDDYLEYMTSYCPATPRGNGTVGGKGYNLKTMEEDFQKMYRWESKIGGLWHMEMLHMGLHGSGATMNSLEELYLDRVASVVTGK